MMREIGEVLCQARTQVVSVQIYKMEKCSSLRNLPTPRSPPSQRPELGELNSTLYKHFSLCCFVKAV